MDALELVLLLDYYGAMLTDKQRECFDMRYNQDLSLGEIAEAQGCSRQAVFDNLTRTEMLLRRMEENIGCISRDRMIRETAGKILSAAAQLEDSSDPAVKPLAQYIIAAARILEE